MRNLMFSAALVLLCAVSIASAQQKADKAKIKAFPVAVQCWTYHLSSFYETLDAVKAIGIKYVQAYPGQVLDKADPSKVFDHSMSDATMREVRAKLKTAGVKVVAYGVVGFENTEPDIRKVFEFARKMGIGTVVCEPAFDDWSLLAKLAGEYKLNVAVHNHPMPSKYARPETVLEHVKSLDKRFGSCADNGHWMRVGVKPLEALRMLDGRILDVHLKDLDKAAEDGIDVPFGQGVAGVRDILAELTRQNYRGYLTIEYENPAEEHNPSPSVKKCVEFVKAAAK